MPLPATRPCFPPRLTPLLRPSYQLRSRFSPCPLSRRRCPRFQVLLAAAALFRTFCYAGFRAGATLNVRIYYCHAGLDRARYNETHSSARAFTHAAWPINWSCRVTRVEHFPELTRYMRELVPFLCHCVTGVVALDDGRWIMLVIAWVAD